MSARTIWIKIARISSRSVPVSFPCKAYAQQSMLWS